MSTILKALRRVEEEQRRDEPKPALEGDWIGEAALEPPPEPAPGTNGMRSLLAHWPWALAVVAGFGLIATGAWMWTGGAAEAPAATAPSDVAVAREAPPDPTEVGVPATPEDFAEAPLAATDPVPEPATEPFLDPAPETAVSLVQRRLREAVEARSERAEPEPIRVAARREPDLPRVEPAPTGEPVDTTAPRPGAVSPAPVVHEVVEVLAAPPEIYVERTRWHPAPKKRTARVRIAGVLHDLREGDVQGELLVTEIRPSVVVFVHAGARLERRLGKR